MFKQCHSKSNICSQTGHIYHLFCPNFCSEMSSLVTNTPKNISLVTLKKINHSQIVFSLHRVLRHGAFKKFCSKSIYVVKQVMFITVLVIISVFRLVNWLPAHQINLSIIMLDKINHSHFFLVYIEFLGMLRSHNFVQNLLYVVKWVMFITVFVLTSVLR